MAPTDYPDWVFPGAPWIRLQFAAGRFLCTGCGVTIDLPAPRFGISTVATAFAEGHIDHAGEQRRLDEGEDDGESRNARD